MEDEEKVLEWLVQQVESDEIEDVTDEMLDMLITKLPNLAVLFCNKIKHKCSSAILLGKDATCFLFSDDNNDKRSQKVLNELENIDDECDQHGIVFVKMDNEEEAREYGIEKVPALLYFENEIPTVYE
ncbi:hypothetical protein J437_LFUL015981, partial [Ladona fulva]